jgi:uncharacterized protein YceH (UPF0502 family)
MHIDIAFNLIRHITSPSCDKFMKGLEKELSDLNLNPASTRTVLLVLLRHHLPPQEVLRRALGRDIPVQGKTRI